ncbi:hypothetical protein AGR6A_Lc40026 [Agrobacterium sp. NCPPB 925]|nr:hypothetical protein AGR6A_Lc40026 [Agrobacterium sp. NCPPB 925]
MQQHDSMFSRCGFDLPLTPLVDPATSCHDPNRTRRTCPRSNRLDHLHGYQKRRILERAVTTIRDMRETIAIPSGPGRDCLLDIHTIAISFFVRRKDQTQSSTTT